MRRVAIILAVLAIALAACGDDGGGSESDAAGDTIDAAPAIDSAPQCPATTIVYINGDGGTYTPGAEDASTNTSQILQAEVTLDPWELSQKFFDIVVDCSTNGLAPYNIEVVTADPGDVDHQEIVVTGSGGDAIGLDPSVTAIAAGACGMIDRPIGFLFRMGMLTNNCRNVLWLVGTNFGLSHTLECSDTMANNVTCDNNMPGYADIDAMCGVDDPQDCLCTGQPIQNSHQSMLAAAGPASCLP